MFLVDRDIRRMCLNKELITDGFNEDNVGSVSYDLTVKTIISMDENSKKYNSLELNPGQTVFVESAESLSIPDNCIGIVTEKNSVMRQGLMIAAPYYQPGHNTKAFIRVTNISGSIVTITQGKRIAQIFFDRLSEKPEKTYSQIESASFNEEFEFVGFGKYESEYQKEIKKIKQAKEDLNEKANSIYANVMVFMGIIAAIFTIVTINFEAFKNAAFTVANILSLNLSLAFTIMIFSGISLFFIGKKRKPWVYVVFLILTILVLIANILICIFIP